MSSTGRISISSCFQHGLQDGYLSLKPHVKGGLFPLTLALLKSGELHILLGGGGVSYTRPHDLPNYPNHSDDDLGFRASQQRRYMAPNYRTDFKNSKAIR